MEIAIIIVAVVCLSISAWTVISKFIRITTSDKITFVKDGKSVTISSTPSKDDIAKLLNF